MGGFGQTDRYNWWQFVEIGYALRYLEELGEDSRIGVSSGDPFGALGCLQVLEDAIETLELWRSHRKTGGRLKQCKEELNKKAAQAKEAVLGSMLRTTLCFMVRDLRREMEMECRERTLFPVLPAKHVEVEWLLVDPEGYFGLPEGGVLELSEDARIDFVAAATLLAIDLPVPAITFALRGAEALVRAFSEVVTGSANRDWGKNVRKLRDAGVGEELTELLDDLREYRNEGMHPGPRSDERWNSAVAPRVIEKCREAVLKMMDYVQAYNQTSAAEAD
jgi:hypothetical protein